MKNKNLKKCIICKKEYKAFKSTDKFCSYLCLKLSNIKQKSIPKVSVKRKSMNEKYSVLRKEFLALPENKFCPITKQPATEVHHKAGRIGFADEWARLNNVPLLIDVRYFLGVSRNGHRWIEENPEEAKKLGYSVDRLTLK